MLVPGAANRSPHRRPRSSRRRWRSAPKAASRSARSTPRARRRFHAVSFRSARACAPRRPPRRRSRRCRRCGAICDDARRSPWPLLIAVAVLAGCATPSARSTLRRHVLCVRRAVATDGAGRARHHVRCGVSGDRSRTASRARWTVRARPAPMPLRPTMSQRLPTSKPSAFPVLDVRGDDCRASCARVDRRARVAVAQTRAATIVVLGDTGCRIKTGDNVFQACNDQAQWPFPAGRRRGGRMRAGPRHPRRRLSLSRKRVPAPATPDAPAAHGATGGTPGRPIFSQPARSLLAAAPWIVVRGNHEIVQSRGAGLVALPRSASARGAAGLQRCQPTTPSATTASLTRVPLGARRATRSSSCSIRRTVGVTPLPPDRDVRATTSARVRARIRARARNEPSTFFMNHHPVLAFAPNPATPRTPYPGNAALQSVLRRSIPTALFPPNVKALLSGHVHLFEVGELSRRRSRRSSSRATAATGLDTPLPLPLRAETSAAPGAVVAEHRRDQPLRIHDDGARRRGWLWTMTARDVARQADGDAASVRPIAAECAPTGWLGVGQRCGLLTPPARETRDARLHACPKIPRHRRHSAAAHQRTAAHRRSAR